MSATTIDSNLSLIETQRNPRVSENHSRLPARHKSHHACSCSDHVCVEEKSISQVKFSNLSQKGKIKRIKKIFQITLETICRVALTVIAFISDPIAAGVGMAGGLAYGLYMGYLEDYKKHKISKWSSGGCAHGFLEDLSGVKFPKALNTVAAFGITLEHLLHACGGHHHSPIPFSIFAALAGVSSGAWIGKGSWHYGRQFSNWVSKKYQASH